jgi:diacylglycerol O-acyltransferase / wax synthase
MKMLSALDALFLHLETPEQPMHVGGLNTFALPKGYRRDFYQDVRTHLVSRMHLAPVFTRRLVQMPMGITNPGWVTDDDIDIDWHIGKVTLPKPGTEAQLNRAVAKLHAQMLPRDRPLWRAWVIDGLGPDFGLAHGAKPVAFYAQFHHAALDGQGAVALAKAILDLEPITPNKKRASDLPKTKTAAVSTGALLAASFRSLLGQYTELARNAPKIASGVGSLAKAVATNASANRASKKPSSTQILGPKTRLNVAITNQRAFATLSLPLAAVKAIGKYFGGSLNDAVLGIVSGGLRGYFIAHKELPKKSLTCAMPISLRTELPVNAANVDNQSSMVLTTLATHLADPVARMQAIIQDTQNAKQSAAAMKLGLPTDMPSLGVPWLLTGLTKLYAGSGLANRAPPLAHVVVSNVPGPPIELYMAGARMTSYYPLSIVVHGIALNITLQSYNGRLDFGVVACKQALPDVTKLTAKLEQAFQDLALHSQVNIKDA